MINLGSNRCPKCGQPMQFCPWGWRTDGRRAFAWRCNNYPCYRLIVVGPKAWTYNLDLSWAYFKKHGQFPQDGDKPPKEFLQLIMPL